MLIVQSLVGNAESFDSDYIREKNISRPLKEICELKSSSDSTVEESCI